MLRHTNCNCNKKGKYLYFSGLDQRLRKRTVSSLPGPKADEFQAKRACTPSQGGGLASASGPALPAPALGVAGPVVRAAGLLRLQVKTKNLELPSKIFHRITISASYLIACISSRAFSTALIVIFTAEVLL